ncbi:MAG: NAD(P)H-hydrate dehydratase [Rhodospirillaceae bacterium]|nr:NAD(P)H-hydrate dehydratase [Rhodospirillaceae bacterium]
MTLTPWQRYCLLSNSQMATADAAAITGGKPGIELMENAGAVVAREIRLRWRPRPVTVLCGPGNNGGDGFVVARLLSTAGWPVSVLHAPAPDRLRGDARIAFDRWMAAAPESATVPWATSPLADAELIVDAMFGAGLTRPVDGKASEILAFATERATESVPVVAIDMPSGVDGNTGACRGVVLPATLTVTFFRAKPGHALLPGAEACGDVVVRDIGIPSSVLDVIAPDVAMNDPSLWRHVRRAPEPRDHKYTRGHVLVIAGNMPGASVLAARAAARSGAGMVTVGWLETAEGPRMDDLIVHLPPSILRYRFSSMDEVAQFRRDRKVRATLVGQGFGLSCERIGQLVRLLAEPANYILDADAVSAFEGDLEKFCRVIGPETILTPHGGEFARIAGCDIQGADIDKLARTRTLAKTTGACVVHKGYDTVVADGDGRAVINGNGCPVLATAGSGDVLAGMITGLRGQGLPAFEAACAAVWIHADAARHCGSGMTADDLPDAIPRAMLRAFE